MAQEVLTQSKRLELVRFTEADAEFVLTTIYQNPDIMSHLGGVVPREQALKKVPVWLSQWEAHGFGLCLVRLKSTKEVVATVILFYKETHDDQDHHRVSRRE